MKLPNKPICEEEEELNTILSMWSPDTYPLLLAFITALSDTIRVPEILCAQVSTLGETAKTYMETPPGKRLLEQFSKNAETKGLPYAIAFFAHRMIAMKDAIDQQVIAPIINPKGGMRN